jgi:hypothetical protein
MELAAVKLWYTCAVLNRPFLPLLAVSYNEARKFAMSHALTVAVSDQVWTALQKQAASIGTPADQLAATVLAEHFVATPQPAPRKRKEDMTDEEKEAARQRFRRHFGSVSLGTGADNESIDADLAREYGDNHEPE